MLVRVLLLVLMFTQLNANQEIDGYVSKGVCKDYLNRFINYGFDGNITIWQKREKIDKKCFITDEVYLLNNMKKQHQKIMNMGLILGTQIFFDDILMITSHLGAYTNKVVFYKIQKDGFLQQIKGGNIDSNYGQPALYIDEFKNSIKVRKRYLIGKNKPCYEIKEDIYEYTTKKAFFSKIIEGNMVVKKCQ